MESMDTPPLGAAVLTLLVVFRLNGAGALNIGLAKQEVEEDDEDEQGRGDCGGGWDEGMGWL